MIFGEAVDAAESAAPAAWVRGACGATDGTVGALVPNEYPSLLRVHAPEPDVDHWWSAYRDLFRTVALVGEAHTSTPETAWLAVWEGHGFDAVNWSIASAEPLDDAGRVQLEAARAKLRAENKRRTTAIRAALTKVPVFALPHRDYYLLTGPVESATEVRNPSLPDDWQRPDLFWPDDRRWFVATDVDLWSLYIGGDSEFAAQLTRAVAVDTEIVTLDYPLESEN